LEGNLLRPQLVICAGYLPPTTYSIVPVIRKMAAEKLGIEGVVRDDGVTTVTGKRVYCLALCGSEPGATPAAPYSLVPYPSVVIKRYVLNHIHSLRPQPVKRAELSFFVTAACAGPAAAVRPRPTAHPLREARHGLAVIRLQHATQKATATALFAQQLSSDIDRVFVMDFQKLLHGDD
jgi:hypothetical protein